MNRFGSATPPDLPTMPTPLARGKVLLWNPQADLRDFLAVIEGDPGLTASVLRAANSAASAPVEPVATARNAIVRIGLETARTITIAALSRAEFERFDQSGLDSDAFWRWLLAVGVLAESFATHDGLPPEDLQTAFTAGLLHQVGRLAYASRSPERYRQVLELVRAGYTPLDAERQVFGADSIELNAQIALDWSLPAPLAEAIVTRDASPDVPLARLVAEAAEVARALGFDDGLGVNHLLDEPGLPANHPRAATVEAIGGAAGVRERVNWFRHATAPRPAAA
jgi:HD-like signal output (HDOD) protein